MKLPCLAALLGLTALVGCGATNTSNLPPTKAVEDLKVELKEVNVAGLERAIDGARGNVVLVDAWFLGCAPCVKKFPSFVEFHNKYKAEGVTCMSLDIMASEVPNTPKVLAFLTKQEAKFPNFILNDTEANIDAWMERHNLVPTPAVLVFDRKGEFVKNLEDATPEKLEALVKELLAAK